MANKTIPDNAIVGKMTMTAKVGEKTLKGATRKQNVFDLDFGAVALSGSLYGKIDGQEYDVETLSEDARKQIAALQVTDAEIQRLNLQLDIAQTARMVYANALKAALPAKSE